MSAMAIPGFFFDNSCNDMRGMRVVDVLRQFTGIDVTGLSAAALFAAAACFSHSVTNHGQRFVGAGDALSSVC